jgi:hypothetical protein
MNIDKIVTESIRKYIQENVFGEESEEDNGYGNSKSKIQSDKAERRDGNNISHGDENQIRRDATKDDMINVAALARKVYPDHTPEGAQSQLRKKLKGLKNDTGSEYHIKSREASVIRKALEDL